MAATYPIRARSNANWRRTFVYRQAADGPPVNLTGSSLRLMARAQSAAAVSIMADISSTTGIVGAGGGIAIEAGPTGAFTVQLPVMADYAGQSGAYDLIRTRPDGSTEPILEGPITVEQGATR